MRARYTALQTKTHRLRSQCLNVARHWIVGLVAVDINWQPTFCCNAAELFKRGRTIRHGAFEMRNAADDIKAHIERTVDEIDSAGRTIVAILRERHELKVDIRFHLFADFDHSLSREKARIADIDMAANGKQALAYGQIAITQGTLDHGFNRQHWL